MTTPSNRPLHFTILHTNDLHSSLIGVSPSADYDPATLHNDNTRGGFARLATVIDDRRRAAEALGPVLVLDAGDFSMQTAFGAAIRETGAAELQLMHTMGYDATTFGNHEFDLGPDGLATAIGKACEAGRCPAIIVSNTDCSADDPALRGLQDLLAAGHLRRHMVLERDGLRFGILGVLGDEATMYTAGSGAVEFPDAIAVARETAAYLRDVEHVDVVIALSHGGVVANPDGTYTTGDDVTLAEQVPGIDIVVGGHSHTKLVAPILVRGRTPVVQSGRYGRNLAELRMTFDGGELAVESFVLTPVDSSVLGNSQITAEIDRLKQITTEAVFASRGYTVDQPLVVLTADLPNTLSDNVAITPLANLVTDAARIATGADVALSANGMMREGLIMGRSGVQTVYDVFSVAPLGSGVIDSSAGSALVTAHFTGAELKDLLEFLLVDNPTHPGEFFPRTSGMRFRFDLTRPKFDVVTAIELGDLDRGYRPIDISRDSDALYSLTCPLYLGAILVTVPEMTHGALQFTAKNRHGDPLTNRVDALKRPRSSTPDLLPPRHSIDTSSLATVGDGGLVEIKEWQAVMDYLFRLPAGPDGSLPVLAIDDRATEVRGIQEG